MRCFFESCDPRLPEGCPFFNVSGKEGWRVQWGPGYFFRGVPALPESLIDPAPPAFIELAAKRGREKVSSSSGGRRHNSIMSSEARESHWHYTCILSTKGAASGGNSGAHCFFKSAPGRTSMAGFKSEQV